MSELVQQPPDALHPLTASMDLTKMPLREPRTRTNLSAIDDNKELSNDFVSMDVTAFGNVSSKRKEPSGASAIQQKSGASTVQQDIEEMAAATTPAIQRNTEETTAAKKSRRTQETEKKIDTPPPPYSASDRAVLDRLQRDLTDVTDQSKTNKATLEVAYDLMKSMEEEKRSSLALLNQWVRELDPKHRGGLDMHKLLEWVKSTVKARIEEGNHLIITKNEQLEADHKANTKLTTDYRKALVLLDEFRSKDGAQSQEAASKIAKLQEELDRAHDSNAKNARENEKLKIALQTLHKQIDSANATIAALRRQLSDSEVNLVKLQGEKYSIEQYVDSLGAQNQHAADVLKERERQIIELSNGGTGLQSRVAELERELSTTQNDLKSLRAQHEQYKRQNNEQSSLLSEKEKELDQFKQRTSLLETTQTSFEESRTKFNSQHNELIQAQAKVSGLTKELSKLKTGHGLLQDELKRVQASLITEQGRANQGEAFASALETQLAGSKAALVRVEHRITSLEQEIEHEKTENTALRAALLQKSNQVVTVVQDSPETLAHLDAERKKVTEFTIAIGQKDAEIGTLVARLNTAAEQSRNTENLLNTARSELATVRTSADQRIIEVIKTAHTRINKSKSPVFGVAPTEAKLRPGAPVYAIPDSNSEYVGVMAPMGNEPPRQHPDDRGSSGHYITSMDWTSADKKEFPGDSPPPDVPPIDVYSSVESPDYVRALEFSVNVLSTWIWNTFQAPQYGKFLSHSAGNVAERLPVLPPIAPVNETERSPALRGVSRAHDELARTWHTQAESYRTLTEWISVVQNRVQDSTDVTTEIMKRKVQLARLLNAMVYVSYGSLMQTEKLMFDFIYSLGGELKAFTQMRDTYRLWCNVWDLTDTWRSSHPLINEWQDPKKHAAIGQKLEQLPLEEVYLNLMRFTQNALSNKHPRHFLETDDQVVSAAHGYRNQIEQITQAYSAYIEANPSILEHSIKQYTSDRVDMIMTKPTRLPLQLQPLFNDNLDMSDNDTTYQIPTAVWLRLAQFSTRVRMAASMDIDIPVLGHKKDIDALAKTFDVARKPYLGTSTDVTLVGVPRNASSDANSFMSHYSLRLNNVVGLNIYKVFPSGPYDALFALSSTHQSSFVAQKALNDISQRTNQLSKRENWKLFVFFIGSEVLLPGVPSNDIHCYSIGNPDGNVSPQDVLTVALVSYFFRLLMYLPDLQVHLSRPTDSDFVSKLASVALEMYQLRAQRTAGRASDPVRFDPVADIPIPVVVPHETREVNPPEVLLKKNRGHGTVQSSTVRRIYPTISAANATSVARVGSSNALVQR